MQFSNALPVTTVETTTSPDGKYTITMTSTTTTTLSMQYASVDGTTILNNSTENIFDSLNTWTIVKGVIYIDGAPLAGTNNVTKLVWKSGVLWQTNGTLWWQWDAINQIWVSGAGPA